MGRKLNGLHVQWATKRGKDSGVNMDDTIFSQMRPNVSFFCPVEEIWTLLGDRNIHGAIQCWQKVERE